MLLEEGVYMLVLGVCLWIPFSGLQCYVGKFKTTRILVYDSNLVENYWAVSELLDASNVDQFNPHLEAYTINYMLRKPKVWLSSPLAEMGEWMTGAAINVMGSIGVNFGTNLPKLGHNQRERQALVDIDESEDKVLLKKPVTQYQSWRIGIFLLYAQVLILRGNHFFVIDSLLAALGSVQFVSNVFFAYLMLNEIVTKRIIMATFCIMAGNALLVAFGNHQSVIYTHKELLASYNDDVYLVYCIILILIVVVHHTIYRRGRQLAASHGEDPVGAWRMLLPYAYAVVSGVVGSHSVLFAKSLSILLRLTMEGDNQLDGWFTYVVFILFAGTASFWMARLNDGLAMFDAILIVPMLQIVWTFFSIFTGFIYFEEYRVFDHFRAAMFGVGVLALFVGMLLLAPQPPPGSKGESVTEIESDSETGFAPLIPDALSDHGELKRMAQHVYTDAAESACRMTVGLGQDRILSSSVFSMPMIASARAPWRSPTLHSEWLIKLTDPGDAENPKGVNFRQDNL